jgi:hypothetical protein
MGLIAWLPLVLLSALQGLALSPDPRKSMLLDIGAHARYLVALPLLVIAEAICLPGLAAIARQFSAMGLIPATHLPRYQSLLVSTQRLLASPTTDLVILLLAYIPSLLGFPLEPQRNPNWIAPLAPGLQQLSLAGWWRALVSQPLYLLLVLSWFWRLLLWARFVRGVSRLDLQLVSSHPDRACGLGFVGTSAIFFIVLAFALSVPSAGMIAQEILHDGRALPDFTFVIAGVAIIQLVLFLGPLLFLIRPMQAARIRGTFQYGALAEAMGQQFESRWMRGTSGVTADALSAQDFSATTDLFSIAANIQGMRMLPISVQQVAQLVIAGLLPFLPVVLVALPLKEILGFLRRLVL